jgi:hypothetical protein
MSGARGNVHTQVPEGFSVFGQAFLSDASGHRHFS